MVFSKKQAQSLLRDAVKKIDEGKRAVEKELKESGVTDFLEEKIDEASKTEVGKKVLELQKDASEGMDKISGKKLLDIVEERLALQDQYNDILATKLDEALKRIEKLESKK